MNKSLGLQLIAYSLLLCGLGCLTHFLAPSLARPTFLTSVVGGVACFLWGLRAIRGHKSKAIPILTLIPISYVMLSQTVMHWSSSGSPIQGHPLAVASMLLLFALSMAMLLRLAYAGEVFGRGAAGHPREVEADRRQPGMTRVP